MTQIIPKKDITVETHWQKELAQSFTTLESLMDYLQITNEAIDVHSRARKLFPMRVPRPFADLMKVGDINDPLLKQVMPHSDEFLDHPEFIGDPLSEQQSKSKGLLHKYKNRVLLIVKGGCAVNCRYCFRRHFPYQENANNRLEWEQALSYIEDNPNIEEVILSGGDPLMAKDDFLRWLVSDIERIENVKRIRIHTRLPIVIPNRINADLLDLISKMSKPLVMVLHINHENEIDNALAAKLSQLRERGVHLLNQAVLLKGINDSVPEQKALNEKVFSVGVLPYYLHLLDKVKGASHFDVPHHKAVKIMQSLIESESGYLIPKLVRELPNRKSKTPIDLFLDS